MRQIFKDKEGIEAVLGPDQFAGLGLPDPAHNTQMADLILVAKPGYAFSNAASGDDLVVPVTFGVHNLGYHGYLATNQKMNAVFIAAGRRIRKGAKLGVIENIHIAPTIAHLLGLKLPDPDGTVLDSILIDRTLTLP